MAIAKRKPDAIVPPVEPPKAFADNAESIIYDERNIPLHALLAHIEGSPWTCDYFGQIVNKDNDLREVDPGQSGLYQQYQKIVALEIRVTSPLTASFDTQTSVTRVVGSGIVYPFMIPNKADYFVADAASNKKALFLITQVDRRTHNKDSVYSIEYQMVGYIDMSEAQTLYGNLEEKVIRKYFFSKDRLLEGLDPILKEQDYHIVSNMSAVFHDLVAHYYGTFFNRNFRNLILPGQSYAIYDHFVAEFLKKIVDTNDHPNVREVKQVPVPENNVLTQKTIWDHIVFKDYNAKDLYIQKAGVVPKRYFSKNPFILGLAHSNVDYVVYPEDPDTSALISDQDTISVVDLELIADTTAAKGAPDTTNNVYTVADKNYQIIHPVLLDDYYVLSEHFYAGDEQQSVLEILVKDYLKGQTLDLKMLTAVLDNYRRWKRLEQFYYGPLLMVLVKEASRSQYGR